ncbi:ATP-binding cassette domain-containing protein [Streptococcus oricebi]|uniref:ABC transporter ATP-binding protein n=1 Tax=Streptococcus oricebi TaxID=1547447 RepID=A0ABS5B185_9STRE|nr:ABC transporter ATP-binding protein [Streptococcus oricebi]MBP2622590.1 ABC transporter ATP-binding protein [Streptococcus oricebi]
MFKYYKYLGKKTKWLVGIGNVINGGVVLAQPLILEKALQLDKGELNLDKIVSFILYGFLIYLSFYSFMLFANYSVNIFRKEIQINIRRALYKKLIRNTNYSIDKKISILTQDMEFVGNNYIDLTQHIIAWSVVAIVTEIYIISQNLLLGSIFVFFTLLRPLPQFILSQRLNKQGSDLSDKRTRVYAQISDSIRGSDVLAFNQALKTNEKRVHNKVTSYQASIQKFEFLSNLIFFFNGFMVFLSQVVPLALGFYLILNGQGLGLSSLVAMYIASGQLVSPIQTIMYDVVEIQGAKPTMDKIYHILEFDKDFSEEKQESQGGGTLHIDRASKSYSNKRLFQDLSIAIPFGSKVLIKGPSGSGKTTLLRCILGEELLDKGSIYLEDELKKYKLSYEDVGIISQNPFLFNETIRYNLSLEQEFDDLELLSVLDTVGLKEEFSDILNVRVENNGSNISGGQRIRLEVARFLLRKKTILLVDEVTASLDTINAKKIRALLLALPITIIEVAHHTFNEDDYNLHINLKASI